MQCPDARFEQSDTDFAVSKYLPSPDLYSNMHGPPDLYSKCMVLETGG